MPDALAIATAYLNRRERTVSEVRARLERADCGSEETEAALVELQDVGLLDDARYARVFVEDKRNLESWGIERIQRGLSDRGVARELVAAALEQAGGDSGSSEVERALELLARKLPEPSGDPRARERGFGMLVRKGYESEVAGDAVRAWARRSAA